MTTRCGGCFRSKWFGGFGGARSPRPRGAFVAIVCALLVAACSRIETTPGRPFAFDANAPFSLHLWIGGWLEGCDTLVVDEVGVCTRVRPGMDDYKQASRVLTHEERRAIAAAAERCGVRDWMRRYSDPGVVDGEQWLVVLVQGAGRRVVACDHAFPESGREFVEEVARIAAMPETAWQTLPRGWDWRDYSSSFWEIELEDG